MALRVAPTFLLAPMSEPESGLDIPNLMAEFSEMTVADFDGWFAGLPEGSISGADRNERQELQALRELTALLRERRRLEVMIGVEEEARDPSESNTWTESTNRRLAEANRHIAELTEFLTKAGWELGDWTSFRA